MADFKSTPVHSYMHAPVHTIVERESVESACQRLQDLFISSLAVIDDKHRLVGVISRSDLLSGDRENATVSNVMTREVLTTQPGDSVAHACAAMVRRGVHRVFVVSGSDLVGVFSTRDAMTAIADARLDHPTDRYMSQPVFTVSPYDTIAHATQLLEKARVTGVVVQEDDWPVGTFTQNEALAARNLPADMLVEEVMNPSVVCMPGSTRMFRAARQALSMGIRRIIVARDRDMVGILSGMDFARAGASA